MKLRRLFASSMLFLTGCASIGNDGRGYPSLAKRAYEGGEQAAQPEAVAESGQADADRDGLLAQLATLTGRARKGAEQFDSQIGRVSAQVNAARGAVPVSENWVVANLGISALEQARYDCIASLASLDRLYADRMAALASRQINGGVREIDAARREVLVLVDRQNDRLDALKSVLKAP